MSLAHYKVKIQADENAALDDTFDLFSSTESRRDKDGKGNQSLQWWKQGEKKLTRGGW